MFEELLLPTEQMAPAEPQRRARSAFPVVVRKSAIHLWQPGEPIAESKRRLIVGVATYSVSDLRLLDRVQRYAREHADSLHVDVFDTLDCLRHADFRKYVPGLGDVYQTPVAGLWERGAFAKGGSGRHAVDLIEQIVADGS